MAEFSRVLNTTINEYIRKETKNILRNRKLLAAMEKKGLLSFNHSGDQMNWKVRYKRTSLATIGDVANLNFPRQNKWKTATLPWRGYAVTDSFTRKEELMNKGQEAIVKYTTNITSMLLDDIRDYFCEELFVDGNAAGNTEKVHGFESCLSNSGADSGGFIGTPSDTYAGLVCTLGNYGGTWTGNWPAGSGDSHYDFWSPLILDYTDASWTTSALWATNAKEVVRYGITNLQRNSQKVDLILLEKDLYRQFLEILDDVERIITERSASNSLLVSSGFGDVTIFDGSDITWEVGVPANVGYMLSMDPNSLELRSLDKQLFNAELPDFDISGLSRRFAVLFYGNLKMNPRNIGKFMSIT